MGSYSPATYAPLTFHDAVPRFLSGQDSPRAYLERCLQTIAAREPVLKGWVTLNEAGAREAADAATARYKAGQPLSPIDGMPIGIKDLINTRDMPTEMGSPLFKGNMSHQDSAAVQALRQAGAVVLGKTVTTELGMSFPGPTTNPFDATRTPGGSSSGSAAVVGAGMVPAAIGTQVVGSIIRPAAFCANTAIKPTLGALNRGERQGYSQSHFGVHAGCLQDMWAVAHAIAERAGGDPGSPGLFGDEALHPARKPTRLIVLEGEGWPLLDAPGIAAFETLLGRLSDAGITILRRSDDVMIERFEQAIGHCLALSRDICAYEVRWTVQNLLEKHGGGLSDSMLARFTLAGKMTPGDYRRALLEREEARQAFQAIAGMADGIIAPSSIGIAPLMNNSLDDGGISHTTGLPNFNAPSSVLGAPTVTVPMMALQGMPFGAQVMGQQHRDAEVCGIARWIQENIAAVEG